MSIERPTSRPARRWLGRAIIAVAATVALSLGGALALSPPFQYGATRLFGKVVDGVKDHPRATVIFCLGAAATLWLAIGVVAAGQEWWSRRTGNYPNRRESAN